MFTAKKPALLLIAVLGTTGCDLDLTGSESDVPPLPDISGSWHAEAYELGPPSSYPDPTAGTCTSVEFTMTLEESGRSGDAYVTYEGSHTGFTVTCSGVTAPATEVFGVSDTVIVIAPGDITGKGSYWGCLGWGGSCDADWNFILDGTEISLFVRTGSGQQLDGGFSWSEIPGTINVVGMFSAIR